VLQDDLAGTCLMAIELKAELADDERLKECLALDESQTRDVPAVKMQKIESVVDDLRFALAVGGCLGKGKARQSSVITQQSSPSR
jgi:hypothetical protein